MEVILALAALTLAAVGFRQIRTLRQSVQDLRHRVDALDQGLHAARAAEEALRASPAESSADASVRAGSVSALDPDPVRPAAAYRQPALQVPGQSVQHSLDQHPVQRPPAMRTPDRRPSGDSAQPLSPPAEPKSPTSVQRGWAAVVGYFTGGNVVVRVGAIVLFFGVAFLLRYASERGLLTVPVAIRLAGVAALGFVLLLLGWRLRHRRRPYALVLQGTGLGIVYITIFAALQIFDLLPGGLSFLLLIAMVALAAALAVAQNSASLAVVAVIGGFLAPILAATGEGGLGSLFGYYLVLNVGIAVIAWFRSWRGLNLLGFVFTFVIATIWGGLRYAPTDRPTAQIFLIAFFVLYVSIALLFASRQPPRLRGIVDATLVFGVPAVAFALQASLVSETEYGLAIAAAVLGAFYGSLRLVCRRLGDGRYLLLSRAFLALGLVFGSLAVPLAVDGEWVATIWALEGAAVLWVAIAQRSRLTMFFALTLQLVAGVLYLPAALAGRADGIAVLNAVFLGGVMLAIGGFLSSWLLRSAIRSKGYPTWWIGFSWAMAGWGLEWWLVTGVTEVGVFVDEPYPVVGWLVLFAVTALSLGALEVFAHWTEWRFTPVGLLIGMVALVLPVALLKEHPFGDLYVLGWVAIFGALYGLLWVRERDGGVPPWLIRATHTGGWWLLAALLYAEATYLASQLEPGRSLDGGVLGGPLVLVAMVGAAIIARPGIWPLGVRRATYLLWGSGALVLALLVWSTVVAPTRGPGSALFYLPVLNPLDLVQLAVLATLVFWWRMTSELSAVRIPRRYGWWVVCAVSFVWLSTVLLRSLSAWTALRYDAESLWSSDLAQACISILWTVIALTAMVLATRRAWRRVWMAAGAILGVVVVKLFVVDMRGSDTLGTVIAFIAVGLLLLIAGYVSPLPPRPVDDPARTDLQADGSD